MTTLTTILGLLPMAFFPGEGSELVAPIGKTVLGGLSFGTLMTLFLMPTIYAVMNKRSDERKARADAKRQRIALGLNRKDFEDHVDAKKPEPEIHEETYSDQSHSEEAHP